MALKLSIAAFLFGVVVSSAQTKLEMPMLAEPLRHRNFEVVNKISASKLKEIPNALPVYVWKAKQPEFSTNALQSLIDGSAFAGTNVSQFLSDKGEIRLASRDNASVFVVMPSAGRIAFQSADNTKDYPPADAVPQPDQMRERLLQMARTFGIGTNEMERNPDGTLHVRRTENTRSHLGGTVKYKSRRSAAVFRSINGYLVRSIDEDRIELEQGINGSILKFQFKWPAMEATKTNDLLSIDKVLAGVKSGKVLGSLMNEYPGDVVQVVMTDFQIFYYVPATFPQGRLAPGAEIVPMIEFLVKFKSKKGEETEGTLFAPLIE